MSAEGTAVYQRIAKKFGLKPLPDETLAESPSTDQISAIKTAIQDEQNAAAKLKQLAPQNIRE